MSADPGRIDSCVESMRVASDAIGSVSSSMVNAITFIPPGESVMMKLRFVRASLGLTTRSEAGKKSESDTNPGRHTQGRR